MNSSRGCRGLLAILLSLPACVAPAVKQTELENGTMSGLERVTHDDRWAEAVADVGRDWLVFSTDKDGQSEIYTKPVIGRGVTRKTTTSATDITPCISRDGSRIAFVSNREGPFVVYVMETARMSAVLKVGEGFLPTFSPDGRSLYYQRFLPREGNETIWRFDFASSQHSQVVTGFLPAVSNKGTQLAYCKVNPTNERSSLWVVDLVSGSESQVASVEDADAILPRWSPDDARLLFTINHGERGGRTLEQGVPLFADCDLAVVNANGTSLTRLTDNPADDIGWAWGADGYIYFSSHREASVDIWRFKPRLVGG